MAPTCPRGLLLSSVFVLIVFVAVQYLFFTLSPHRRATVLSSLRWGEVELRADASDLDVDWQPVSTVAPTPRHTLPAFNEVDPELEPLPAAYAALTRGYQSSIHVPVNSSRWIIRTARTVYHQGYCPPALDLKEKLNETYADYSSWLTTPYVFNRTACLKRARLGENVLTERLARFITAWDEETLTRRHRPEMFLCDVPYVEPGYSALSKIADVIVNKGDGFSWSALKSVREEARMRRFPRERGLILYFPGGRDFCGMLDVDAFRAHVDYPVVVIGPFGDHSNYAHFSGGEACPLCFVRNPGLHLSPVSAQFEARYCGAGSWEQLRALMQEPNLRLWATFMQTIEHAKIISFSTGASRRMVQAFTRRIPEIQEQPKEYDFAVTFGFGAEGKRREWRKALQERVLRRHATVMYSSEDPQRAPKNDSALRNAAWDRSLLVYSAAKLVVGPGGLGIDTKRPFETILAGSAVVSVGRQGLDKTYRNLPYVRVTSPDHLDGVQFEPYENAVCKEGLRFEKMTVFGWNVFLRQVRDASTHDEARAVIDAW